MADGAGSGDWLLAQELYERGDPAFVDALRAVDDADTLGRFAHRWLADTRPEARRLLLDYLDRPLNAFRHEALVKRAFKAAEAAGDDELVGRFLVAFDRSVRRVRKTRKHYESLTLDTEREANTLAAAWRNQGLEGVNVWRNWQKKYHVFGQWVEPFTGTAPDSTMPRGAVRQTYAWDPDARKYRTFSVPDWVLKLKLDPAMFRKWVGIPPAARKGLENRRLFSVGTRNYLRRRAWRYFRRLGRTRPDRYIPAVAPLLTGYRDEDVADGLALLDNWGLIHVLFRHSPCLTRNDRAFHVATGRSLSELEPAPAFERLWAAAPRSLVDVLVGARCRAVRGWAVAMIRRNLAAVASVFSLDERLGLLTHDDPELVGLVADLIRGDPSLAGVPVGRWLELVETASPAALDVICEVMATRVDPGSVSLGQAARLAAARPVPVARLGLDWLRTKTPRDVEECQTLLGLAEAGSDVVRPELVRWAAGALSASDLFRSDWVVEWLDSRHRDVRDEAWRWLRNEPRARDDVAVWQRLMETPYDDVRVALVAELEARVRGAGVASFPRGALDPDLVRLLWASVLLNVHRGGRAKPAVLRQILSRVESHPADLPRLLPLLAVALRSHRGPEWRAGLAAVVRLSARGVEAAAAVRAAFPELRLEPAGA